MLTCRSLYNMHAAFLFQCQMTHHLNMLVISGELPTGTDHYTLLAWPHISETGTGLDFIEPYYEEPCTPNTT